jgi:hypothetical protein
MIDVRQIDTFLHYYNEANKLSPPLLEEKLGALYANYSTPHPFANHVEDKVVFETSFASHPGMKVYI